VFVVKEYKGTSSVEGTIVDCWYAIGSGDVPHVNPSVLISPPPRFVKIPPLNADRVVVENGKIVDTIGTLNVEKRSSSPNVTPATLDVYARM
jgi:hypothetical protein